MFTFRLPMPLPENFEPAERDPKKLRRTAWILVAIMVVGGWLVMKAYNNYVAERAKDDRPSIIHRIQPERSLRVVRQDGETVDLMDLRDKVFAIHVVHTEQMEESSRSIDILKRAAETFSQEEDFRIVTLILNPGPPDQALKQLKQAASAMEVELPQWWVASNEQKTLTKFIRKELKPSMPPGEVEGRWKFDPSIVLVDRNGHLRRAVVPQKKGGPPYIAPFDFDQAAQWDAEGKKTGTDLSNAQQLELLLMETIEKLLAEPFEE